MRQSHNREKVLNVNGVTKKENTVGTNCKIECMTNILLKIIILFVNQLGYSGRAHGTKNNTKDECNPEVGTGIRRILINVYNNPNQQCYRQFFVPQQGQGQGQGQGRPPVGLRQPNDPNIRYICQPPGRNEQPPQTYYATMFDELWGIAVFSAYRLTHATAHFPVIQVKVGFCPTPGNLFTCPQKQHPILVNAPTRTRVDVVLLIS